MIAHAESPQGAAPPPDPAAAPGAAPRAAPPHEATTDPSPLEPLWATLAALRETLALYLAAKADLLTLRLRRLVLAVVGGLLALLAGAAIVTVSAALVVRGIAELVTRLLGGRAWAGDLITGLGLLGVIALVTYFALRGAARASRQRTVKRYERRRNKDRAAFGRHAHAGPRAGAHEPAATRSDVS